MATARETPAERLQRLEEENALLTADLAAARAELDARETAVVEVIEAPPRPRRRPGRTIASVALLVVATIILPVALLANAAQRQLTDTEAFVDTLAPLVADPQVQDYLVEEIVAAIDENVDIAGLTSDLFAGIETLDLPPRALDALKLLEQPAVTGIETLVTTVVREVVTSEQFQDVVAQALRVTHSQLVATLSGDSNAAVTIDASGVVGIQLGPILAAVKASLLDAGVGVANLIPESDRVITIAESAQLARLTTAYQLAVAVGIWLPWIDLLLFALAVVVAKRRSVALVAAGLCLAGVGGVVALTVAIGRFYSTSALSPFVPLGAASAIYDALVTEILRITLIVVVLGLTVAIVGAIAAPWGWSTSLRRSLDRVADAGREAGQRRGVTTGRFGEFLTQWRLPIRIGIGVIAAALVLFVRPSSPAFIIWTAIIALLLVVVLRLLERPVRAEAPVVA